MHMIRAWLTVTLGLAVVGVVGCGSAGGSGVYAGAPDGRMSTHYTVRDGGRYTLFHVTKFSNNGIPAATEQVISYELRPGDTLGFNWVSDPAKVYDPDAHLNLEAYAAGHRIELGGVNSPEERYYWADADAWNGYWNAQPLRNIGHAAAL